VFAPSVIAGLLLAPLAPVRAVPSGRMVAFPRDRRWFSRRRSTNLRGKANRRCAAAAATASCGCASRSAGGPGPAAAGPRL